MGFKIVDRVAYTTGPFFGSINHGAPMTDRTETCTPEERRLLDIMHKMHLDRAEASSNAASIHFAVWEMNDPAGHDLIKALYAARGDRD